MDTDNSKWKGQGAAHHKEKSSAVLGEGNGQVVLVRRMSRSESAEERVRQPCFWGVGPAQVRVGDDSTA